MLCRNSCGFYANADNDGYCSKCKVPDIIHEKKDSNPLPTEIENSVIENIVNINVCIVCGKKVKISAVQCKCKQPLCKSHVIESQHKCSYDYKKHGQDILSKQNPKIVGNKFI